MGSDTILETTDLTKTFSGFTAVNKVNLRKEFFRVSLDDLEKLVGEIAPTADFKRTVLAEQYRQSLSISHVAENPDASEEEDDEEDEV